MASFTAIHCRFDLAVTFRGGGARFSRSQLCLPRKLVFCRAKLDPALDASSSLTLVTPSLLASEEEEAKSVLTVFLMNQGFSSAEAARIINKSDLFIDHLVSRLRSVCRELTDLEIRDALLLYLESLHEEHGISLVDVIENFPHLPDTGKPVVPVAATQQSAGYDAKKLRAVLRVSVPDPSGSLPPHVNYLLELGFGLERIKTMARKHPPFAYYSLEGKIRPLIEFLLDLGVLESDLPSILVRCTGLCGISLSENIIPTMALLETLGLDKRKWAKVISSYPVMLACSKKKIEATVQFLYEIGLSQESIGKILTRCPQILGHSVEYKLRPSAEYFQSLGVDAAVVIRCCPQIMNLSIENNLKPFTEFFLENGFSMEEVGTMITKFGTLYSYSLKDNVVPKWEFFLTMDYSREDLINFPQFFGYSLIERIKPRYKVVTESGVKISLSKLLYLNDDDFELLLKKKIEKLQFIKFC